jgi:hypothetical protein
VQVRSAEGFGEFVGRDGLNASVGEEEVHAVGVVAGAISGDDQVRGGGGFEASAGVCVIVITVGPPNGVGRWRQGASTTGPHIAGAVEQLGGKTLVVQQYVQRRWKLSAKVYRVELNRVSDLSEFGWAIHSPRDRGIPVE